MKKTMLSAAVLMLCAAAVQAAPAAQDKAVMATVNGKQILKSDVTAKMWWQYGVQSLSELIDEKLLMEEAARLKIKADNKEVEKRYESIVSASSDKAQAEKNLAAVGWTVKDLKDLLGRQLAIREVLIQSGKIAVTDEDVKSYFEANKEKLLTPETVKLRQIYVNTRAEADAAVDALITGSDFAKLSALKSADPALRKNSGDLGYVNKGVLLPDMEQEIFSLKEKQYSKVIPTGKGFSIFYVEEHRQPQQAEFEKAKDELKIMLTNQAIAKELPVLTRTLREKADIKVMQ